MRAKHIHRKPLGPVFTFVYICHYKERPCPQMGDTDEEPHHMYLHSSGVLVLVLVYKNILGQFQVNVNRSVHSENSAGIDADL
jgi:hypothetical protein